MKTKGNLVLFSEVTDITIGSSIKQNGLTFLFFEIVAESRMGDSIGKGCVRIAL